MYHANKRQSPEHYKRIVAIRTANYNRTFNKRFWARVQKTKTCWNWTACKNEHGYGKLSRFGKLTRAHRVSYELTKGAIPEGKWVLHHCDNPACVRPKHLYLGDHADNTRDAVARRRYSHGQDHYFAKFAKGENNCNARVNLKIVLEMRSRYTYRYGYSKLAKEFGIGKSTVYNIINRKTWKHV